jgi:CubicO group peptidase (beta-lactamase class C family)
MIDLWLHVHRGRLALCLAMTVVGTFLQGCRPEMADETASAKLDGRTPSGSTLERAADAEKAGRSTEGLNPVLDVVRTHIENETTPGAVVLIARHGKIVLEEALGHMSYATDAQPMTRETIFDLASITKVTVTTTLAMMLAEQGALDLDAPVQAYIPEFQGEVKEQVTVRDLFAHASGMRSWVPFFREIEASSTVEAKMAVIDAICQMPPAHPPRIKTVYSDPAYILLGEMVERISGEALEVLAEEWIFGPLGMEDTQYRPPKSLLLRIAPTEFDPWRDRVIRGEVHDENAFFVGGVTGHAGLFGTASDLAIFGQMMANGGVYNGRRYVRAETIRAWTNPAELVPGSSRAVGWDTARVPASPTGHDPSIAFWHTGFTGVSLWIDPERELVAILLTNRIHPTRENQQIYQLRAEFHRAVNSAVIGVAPNVSGNLDHQRE